MTYKLQGICLDCGCKTTVENCETDNRGFVTCPICGCQVVTNASNEQLDNIMTQLNSAVDQQEKGNHGR